VGFEPTPSKCILIVSLATELLETYIKSHTDRQTDQQMDGRMNRWTEGRMFVGRMSVQPTDILTNLVYVGPIQPQRAALTHPPLQFFLTFFALCGVVENKICSKRLCKALIPLVALSFLN
jgi:hypothetical protein